MKFTAWVESPSKFVKEAAKHYSPPKRFVAGSCVDGVFKDNPHTAWERL